MPELHETRMGQKLITTDIPRLIDVLVRIANALEEHNEIMEIVKGKCEEE